MEISGASGRRVKNILSVITVIFSRFWFVLVVFVMCVDIDETNEQSSVKENKCAYEIHDRK
jgi:preprotein translocase subunit SecG